MGYSCYIFGSGEESGYYSFMPIEEGSLDSRSLSILMFFLKCFMGNVPLSRYFWMINLAVVNLRLSFLIARAIE